MKLNILVGIGAVALLGFGVTSCNKGPGKAKLDNLKAKYSYAIGHQIASNIKNQKIDMDKAAFMSAVDQAFEGKKAQMTEDEMRDALRKMSQSQRESRDKEGQENVKKGTDYLATNLKREGVKATPSGLQYRVVKQGDGKKPKAEDRVKVHYKGTLIDGTEFDSSHKRGEPAQFPVQGVIKGWQEGLQLMAVGSTYEFVIPSELAYGSTPRPTIPSNSVLVFEVQLLEIMK